MRRNFSCSLSSSSVVAAGRRWSTELVEVELAAAWIRRTAQQLRGCDGQTTIRRRQARTTSDSIVNINRFYTQSRQLTVGRRAFSIAGPTVWNSLPDELGDPPCGSDSLSSFLRQSCLVFTNVTSALQVF